VIFPNDTFCFGDFVNMKFDGTFFFQKNIFSKWQKFTTKKKIIISLIG